MDEEESLNKSYFIMQIVEIKYTNHLILRLKIRKIPFKYPKLILEDPNQRFFDVLERKQIAIKRLKYNGKIRNMMIAYETKGNFAEIITIHPIADERIINRLMSGRWKNG